jgi:hypothetical protein
MRHPFLEKLSHDYSIPMQKLLTAWELSTAKVEADKGIPRSRFCSLDCAEVQSLVKDMTGIAEMEKKYYEDFFRKSLLFQD